MEKRLEIVDISMKREGVKLTVAKERITIKFSLGYDIIKKKEIIEKILLSIPKQLEYPYTLRGSLDEKNLFAMKGRAGQLLYKILV